jgi:hypothetical protein
VWIANSGEHTVSKLDTRTMTEVGRYYTRPDQQGSPSRTSVSIDGKAVVVANRHGGLTKIWARKEYCADKNGNGKIDTSTGKNNVLAFDQDECIAWYTPSRRPRRSAPSPGPPASTTSSHLRVRGPEDLDRRQLRRQRSPPATAPRASSLPRQRRHRRGRGHRRPARTSPAAHLGAYGAAVDTKNNDLWFFVFGGGVIFQVDHETLAGRGRQQGGTTASPSTPRTACGSTTARATTR